MNRQFVATGATVDEAIENACRELGVSPEDVTPEILRLPKKGFLGIGKTDAEVRVTVMGEEEPKKAEKKQQPAPQPKPKKAEISAAKPAPVPSAKPAAKPVEKPADKPAPVQKPKPVVPAEPEPAAEPKEKKPEISEKPAKEPVKTAQPAVQEQKVLEQLPPELLQPKMDIAKEYLSAIFEKMGVGDIQIRMEPAENRTVMIHLEGGDIGTVIGKRGETLDAIQYLVSLASNRSEGEYVRFTINAGNYREKREETLRVLAQKMARKVLKTGRPVALEPMNPYERRIIHAVVTDIEGVYSKSSGEEPNRKVVIKPSSRNSGGTRRDGGNRRPGGRGHSHGPRPENRNDKPQDAAVTQAIETPQIPDPPKPAEPVQKTEKPFHDDSIKLYSKIEL